MGTLGYRFVSLEHLIRNLSSSKLGRVAVITFDDGFKDLYQNAYPILERRGIPFALFLITSTVDSKRLLWIHRLYAAIDSISPARTEDVLRRHGISRSAGEDLARYVSRAVHAMDRRGIEELTEEMTNAAGLSAEKERRLAEELYLTKADLSEMKRGGLSIEAHGHEHVPLANASEAETKKEIADSVEYIRGELHGTPSFYSLAYGSGNRFVKEIIKALGLLGIATTKRRLIRPHEDTFDLPRICVSGDITALYLDLGRVYLKAILRFLPRAFGNER